MKKNLKKRNKRKQFLIELREALYDYVIQLHYQDKDVALYSDKILQNIVEDIYILSCTIVEGKLIDAKHNIIKDEDYDDIYNSEIEDMEEEEQQTRVVSRDGQAASIDYELIFKEMNKIVKSNCETIKKSLSEQINVINAKSIENEKAIREIRDDFNIKIKKLSDKIDILEGKVMYPKIKYVNVVSNPNLSFENDDYHKLGVNNENFSQTEQSVNNKFFLKQTLVNKNEETIKKKYEI